LLYQNDRSLLHIKPNLLRAVRSQVLARSIPDAQEGTAHHTLPAFLRDRRLARPSQAYPSVGQDRRYLPGRGTEVYQHAVGGGYRGVRADDPVGAIVREVDQGQKA